MLARYSLFQLAGKFIPGLIGFGLLGVLTRLLPPEEFGVYGLVTAMVQLIVLAAFTWLGMAVMRLATGRTAAPNFPPAALNVFAAVCLAVTAGAGVLLLTPIVSGSKGVIAVAVFGAFVFAYFDMRGAFYVASCDFVSPMLLNIGRALASAAVAISIALYGGSGLSVSIGYYVAALAIVLLFASHGRIDGKLHLKEIRQICTFGLPLAGSIGFLAIANLSDRLVLNHYSGTTMVGLYAAATIIVQNTLQLAGNAIGAAAFPLAVLAYDGGVRQTVEQQLGRNLVALLGCLLPGAVGLCLLAPNIAQVLVGKDYREAVVALTPFLAGTTLLSGIRGNFIDHCFHLTRTTWHLLRIAIVMALCNLVSLFLLVPSYGYIGAALAGLITAGVGLVYGMLAARRVYPTGLPLAEIGKVIGATAAMAALLAAINDLRGPEALFAQVFLGGITYSAAVFALNVMNVRHTAITMMSRWRRV